MTQPRGEREPSIWASVLARPVLGWSHHIWLIGMAVVMYATDVFTKQLVVHLLRPDQPVYLLGPWLQLQLRYNSGAAFSLGESFTMVFSAIALAALVVLVAVAPRAQGRLENVVVGLLIAGVAGNLTDRLLRAPGMFHGHVVDFVGVQYFAVFNVADMCITAAAIIVIVALLRSSRPRE